VFPMAEDARAASIVRSTIDLAHALGLGIVAEGVEHRVAAEQLAAYGCDHAQGYFWTRPLAAEALLTWMRAREADPAVPLAQETRSDPADDVPSVHA
ncbi:MAG TPA: EAL domain-containing protein, partial [Polyangiaceae bacterium]|nr:EAL domain-containing protein [Polyangiaceae bacterium]